jgi:hypothetical protein
MSKESVDKLINQLEELRIKEASVLRRLVSARERETRARTRSNEDRVRNEDTRPEQEVFSIGDRVQVTNHVRVAFGRAVTIDDRRATVTSTTLTRVYFKTVNGNTTWRAGSNRRLGNDSEVWADKRWVDEDEDAVNADAAGADEDADRATPAPER